MTMTTEEAILTLRQDKKYAQVLKNAYLGADVQACGEQFSSSAEFAEVCKLLGKVKEKSLLDLGAGTGIASYAFAKYGVDRVYALEPDPSDVVGYGAMRRLTCGLPVTIIAGFGEEIPLPDNSVDIVYTRQVLHHSRNLARMLDECTRILKHGGVFLACREHVVDDEAQREIFLKNHLLHPLTGTENAFPLPTYLQAIRNAGLEVQEVLGAWDTVINIFPALRTTEELHKYPQTLLKMRWGRLGAWLGRFALVQDLVWKRLKRPTPGRMYTFLAMKPPKL